MRKSNFVVLDTETTGLSPRSAGLTEIFAAKTNSEGKILDTFHSLINPQQRIPSFITRLTGITNDMVKDAPLAQETLTKFHRFLGQKDVVVGHNVKFDLNFLNHYSAQSQQIAQPSLCTLLLSRRVMAPQPLPSYKLGRVADHFGLSLDGAHRAQVDVEMTIGVQQELFRRLEGIGAKRIDDILRLQYLPLRKAAEIMSGEKDRFFSQ